MNQIIEKIRVQISELAFSLMQCPYHSVTDACKNCQNKCKEKLLVDKLWKAME